MDISGRESESLVVRALYSTEGAQCLADTYSRLRRMIERRRFNLERASAMYMFSVDAAVWKHLRGHPLRRIMYRNYLISDDGPATDENWPEASPCGLVPPINADPGDG